jgi:nickel superoxide dismutase
MVRPVRGDGNAPFGAFDRAPGPLDTSRAGQPPARVCPTGGIAHCPTFPEVARMSFLTRILAPTTVARAHCDLPCGVYDPEQARIEAESCFRIMEKYQGSEDATFRTRAIHIKEERAELVKHHLDVLWHDYFKPEHLDAVPNLHQLFWDATKQASKVKASVDPADGQKLLDLIGEIDGAWKTTGGPSKTRVAGRPG